MSLLTLERFIFAHCWLWTSASWNDVYFASVFTIFWNHSDNRNYKKESLSFSNVTSNKCPCSDSFRSVFFRIWTEYGNGAQNVHAVKWNSRTVQRGNTDATNSWKCYGIETCNNLSEALSELKVCKTPIWCPILVKFNLDRESTRKFTQCVIPAVIYLCNVNNGKT